jgi:hypothetical protein
VVYGCTPTENVCAVIQVSCQVSYNKDGTGNNGIDCMGNIKHWWNLHQQHVVYISTKKLTVL